MMREKLNNISSKKQEPLTKTDTNIRGIREKRRCWKCKDFTYIHIERKGDSQVYTCERCNNVIWQEKNNGSSNYPLDYFDEFNQEYLRDNNGKK